MLKTEFSLSKTGVDPAENEPEVRKKDQKDIRIPSYSLFSAQQDYIFVHSS